MSPDKQDTGAFIWGFKTLKPVPLSFPVSQTSHLNVLFFNIIVTFTHTSTHTYVYCVGGADNPVELVLSFSHVVPKIKLRWSVGVASVLTRQAFSLA